MAKQAKALEAKVKDDHRLPSVTAFGGREYVKSAWRPVPPEQADSAGAHPFLDVREAGGEDVTVAVTETSPLSSSEDSPPASRASSGKPEAGRGNAPSRGGPATEDAPPAKSTARRGKSL